MILLYPIQDIMQKKFHLKPLAQNVKPYKMGTNDYLRKIVNHPLSSDGLILWTKDIVDLYPDIPQDEGLTVRKSLEFSDGKTISTDCNWKLAECDF